MAKQDVAYYLKEISRLADRRDCVYRGQADADWGLTSGAVRRIRESVKDDTQSKQSIEQILDGVEERIDDTDALKQFIAECKKPINDNGDSDDDKLISVSDNGLISYHQKLLNDAKKHDFSLIDGQKSSDLELLAQLQHFGAATIFLDFSKKVLVALFNACQEREDKDGKIFIVPYSGIDALETSASIDEVIKSNEPSYFDPMVLGQAKERMASQSGLFLINMPEKKDYPEQWEEVIIDSKDKESIMDELKSMHDISADTLFRDLPGFAQNNAQSRMLRNEFVFFHKGLFHAEYGHNEKGIGGKFHEFFEKAIECYSEAIRLKPDWAIAYNNRGVAKAGLGQHKNALKDYDKAIELNPNYAHAYNNRGNAKAKLGKPEEAMKDYDRAIELNPDDANAYYNRGITNNELGNYEEAIKDYDEAIKINPNFAAAYNNRGNTKKNLDRIEDARKDYEQTIVLEEQQGKKEDARLTRIALEIFNENHPKNPNP